MIRQGYPGEENERTMEIEPEVTFLFQFGNIRDTQRVPLTALNLKSLKDLACDFINEKVGNCVCQEVTKSEHFGQLFELNVFVWKISGDVQVLLTIISSGSHETQ